jgi:RNA polymerase sigma-70 factor (ECF subfamily)
MAALVEVPQDEWIAALHGPPPVRDAALAELHALLLRTARFELHRRQVPRGELDDMAAQAAADAMVALLAKLDTFRGASRFTTWAYKFALLEAGVKARRRAWRDREVPLDDTVRDDGPPAQQVLENAETLRAAIGGES